MPLPAVEEGSGSRRSRSTVRRRRRDRSESLEPGPTASSVRRPGVKERKSNRAGESCGDEKVRRVKKIRMRGEAALPSDAGIARNKEEVQGKDGLCKPRIRQEVVVHDSNAVEVCSETFRNESEEDEEDAVSSAPSSPLCEPRIQQEVIGHDSNGVGICKAIDIGTLRAYRQFDAKFNEKLARIIKLPTLVGVYLALLSMQSCIMVANLLRRPPEILSSHFHLQSVGSH